MPVWILPSAMLVVLLAGCGLKDDLYLPPPQPEVASDQPAAHRPDTVNADDEAEQEPSQGTEAP